MSSASRPRVLIRWDYSEDWHARALLRRAALAALADQGFQSGELSVAVVDADRMSRLHQQYLKISGATDVLTFDLGTGVDAGIVDGEVIVCADVARERAMRRSTRLAEAKAELALYVVHGILHLAGYDDHDADDFKRMHAREDRILAAIGLGRVFESGA
jgi:probable rRNA maturation factor